MAKRMQLRKGSTADHSTFTGALGEPTYDTDKNTIVVHDGATVGGKELLLKDGDGSQLTGIDSLPAQGGNAGKVLTTDGTTASWDVSDTSTTTPTLSFSSPINENTTTTITITVEENAIPDLPLSDVGVCSVLTEISNISWTAIFTAKDILGGIDESGTITCDAVNAYEGKLRSATSSDAVIITYVPVIADDAIADTLTTDASNDGYDFV